MSVEHIHFVTGKLAEQALRQTVQQLSEKQGFVATVQVMPISVAALMTSNWIAKRIEIPNDTTRVIVPGYCDDVTELSRQFGIPFEAGPKDLRRLDEHLGEQSAFLDDFGKYDIEIIAEINHAPRLTINELIDQAQRYSESGADLIDFGCIPGSTFENIPQYVSALKNEGFRVSIDSLNPNEISLAAQAGAELVLSVNSTNREFAPDWGIEVVVIPDDFDKPEEMETTIAYLEKYSVPFRLDPILEPIGCGFARSLSRYVETRKRFPEFEMMMGIGNLTELTDVDSAGINVLLLGFCQELKINSVLTTEVINWAKSSVKECDLARRLVHFAVANQIPPKHLNEELIVLRDAKLDPFATPFLEQLAAQIKDHNFRIFGDGNEIHVLGGRRHFRDNDPFKVFDQMQEENFPNLDPSHSFYLGFEMCKAMIANQLGKEYQQDQALNFGHLTVEEIDRHRLQKKKRNQIEQPE